MNLYSNKQKWKIVLLVFALVTVGASLFFSNTIVSRVGDRERERAQQWAEATKKKIELVQLTDMTFSQLRDKEREKMEMWIEATKEVSKSANLSVQHNYDFPLLIIEGNKDIPVIVVDDRHAFSSARNIDFDTTNLRQLYPTLTRRELVKKYEDSLVALSEIWEKKNPSFTVEIFEDFFMTYIYNDSKEITRLEAERDSLIQSFNNDLISNKGTAPLILIDSKTNAVLRTNIPDLDTSSKAFSETILAMEKANTPISIEYQGNQQYILYYDDSPELKQLQYFPYIQFLVIGLFAIIGYLIFSTFRKAEQNQVWAGMAKETAHQLGTPLSSLMAWVQLLETQGVDPMVTIEMQKDVDRLEKVTDRFSKIGSGIVLDKSDISATVRNVVNYLRPRISDKVTITMDASEEIITRHNASLIEWVIENICKNAVDAMEGQGELTVSVKSVPEWVHIDIRDTGKGIPPKQLKTIFQPGFSTKKRGWGLGLSLVKRIVKEYHKGEVYVLESHVGKGTTFRISLPL